MTEENNKKIKKENVENSKVKRTNIRRTSMRKTRNNETTKEEENKTTKRPYNRKRKTTNEIGSKKANDKMEVKIGKTPIRRMSSSSEEQEYPRKAGFRIFEVWTVCII